MLEGGKFWYIVLGNGLPSDHPVKPQRCRTPVAIRKPSYSSRDTYRDRLKGVQILLSGTQAEPGRTVKQEQEEISRNHVQAF